MRSYFVTFIGRLHRPNNFWPLSIAAVAGTYAATMSSRYFWWYPYKRHVVETAWLLFGAIILFVVAGRVVRTKAHGETTPPLRWADLVAVLTLSAVTFIVYWPALSVGFLSDDFVLLSSVGGAYGWRNEDWKFIRPLPIGLFREVNAFAGQHAAVLLHLINVALHLVNGALVGVIARRLGLPRAAALAGITLFLVFPAAAEAVVWCSGLQDVIAATATLTFIAVTLGSGNSVALAAVFGVGLLSKETAVVGPTIGLLLVAARRRGLPKATWVSLIVCLATSVVFSLWRLSLNAGSTSLPSRYVVKTKLAILFSSLAVPWTAAELQRAVAVGLFMTFSVVLICLAIMRASGGLVRAGVVLSVVCWIVIAIVPVNALFYVGEHLEGSRYLYLPSAGWALLLAIGVVQNKRVLRSGVALILAGTAVLWAMGAHKHIDAWQRAASERDRILSAAERLREYGCTSVQLSGVTDSIDGAYVFRNGLAEAIRRSNNVILSLGPTEPRCRFTWTGTEFIRRL
jgi:hypothetical protein